MKKRIAFREMYSNISEDWDLNKNKVDKIINKYTEQLITEILDDTPFTISPYFMDYRKPEEYCYDLLLGRIVEDLVILWMEKYNYVVEKIGNDKDGVIHRKPMGRITNRPDLRVGDTEIEIQTSSTGKLKVYHVKENKGRHIINNDTILLFIIGNEYLIIDKEVLSGAELKPNPSWGNKECYWIYPKEYKLIREGCITLTYINK